MTDTTTTEAYTGYTGNPDADLVYDWLSENIGAWFDAQGITIVQEQIDTQFTNDQVIQYAAVLGSSAEQSLSIAGLAIYGAAMFGLTIVWGKLPRSFQLLFIGFNDENFDADADYQ